MAAMEFSDVVLRMIMQFTNQHINTAIPAKVLAVNKFTSKQIVDVQPLIDETYEGGGSVELPAILDVPVVFPSAGGGIISFPIKVGDTVLLVFSKKSIDEWMQTTIDNKRSITPSDKRNFSINDAVVFPGLYTQKTNLSPNAVDVEIKFNGLSIKLEKSSKDVTIANPTHSLKLKNNGDVLHSSGAKITAAGDFVTAAGVSLDSHVHAQGNDASNDVQVDTEVPTVP